MSEPRLQQKWLQTSSGKICYFINKEFENRPAVVLLHGLSSNHTTWNQAARFLKELRLNCLAPDQRGHGHSDKIKKRFLYKLPVFTQDLKEIIEQENLGKVILVGYSYGGYIAIDYAIKNPASVAGLILISANHVNPMKYWHLDFLTPVAAGVLNLLAWLLLWQKRKNYYYYDHATARGYWHSTFTGYTTMPLAINFWMLAAVAYLDFSREIAKINCPTLIIKAKKDPFLSIKEAKDMAAKIKNIKIVTLEEDTHFLASRYQEKIIKVIADWLKEKNLYAG